MKLDRFLNRARELDRIRDFFANVIGLRAGPRPDFPFPGYRMYSGHMPVVHPAQNGDRPAPAGSEDDSGPIDHIAFTADNYAELTERPKAAGANFEERTVPGGAARQVFVHGPEGVRVEIRFSGASVP